MLESYFVKPQTVDQVRASWIGAEVERYVEWLADRGYSSSSVLRRVPLLVAFGEFAKARGARAVEDLPRYVEPFVAERVASHGGFVALAMSTPAVRSAERFGGRLSRCCDWWCRGSSVPAGGIARIRSLRCSPGSSSTWCASAGFAQRRSASTDTT